MPNRLAGETSPYLLQHAHNPVDWYPWSAEALAKARAEDKPVFLSIGYSACHWCHVMERESFENEATARFLNEHFVSIKVDREERPDVDAIYMQAVQAMTGHGGWPMSVFLAPSGEPFYGGTYFPPDDRHGMPSFARILAGVLDAWVNRRDSVTKTTAALRELYVSQDEPLRSLGSVTQELLIRAAAGLAQQYDARHGGWGGAPKFPQAMSMQFLLQRWKRTGAAGLLDMVRNSLHAMANGGIYDQVGGGWHRYTVDGVWLVPHFEKMLYDNALITRVAVQVWQATRDPIAARVVDETIAWLVREMTDASGGFYSALDADSEGHEGKFYVWSAEEFDVAVGSDASVARAYWGVTNDGNFEGTNILNVPAAPQQVAETLGLTTAELETTMARARAALASARSTRVRPRRDDKILASWNALMLRAIADAARAFGRDDWRALAVANGEFLFREMVRDAGRRVMRTHTSGQTRLSGYLEDHAAVALGALGLYQLTFNAEWLARARKLADSMLDNFWSEEHGGFYDTAHDHEQLITRPRDATDNATPSGTSLAVELLLLLGDLTQNAEYTRRATLVLEALTEPMARHALAFGYMLCAADIVVHGAVEVALAGDPHGEDFRALARVVGETYVPSLVLAGGDERASANVPLLKDREARNGRATAYVCRGFSCDAPTAEPSVLREQLEVAGR